MSTDTIERDFSRASTAPKAKRDGHGPRHILLNCLDMPIFAHPYPKAGELVYCAKCDAYRSVIKRMGQAKDGSPELTEFERAHYLDFTVVPERNRPEHARKPVAPVTES